MPFVFYRSVSAGWRVGFAASLDGANVRVCDGPVEETVSSLDIYIPQLSDAEGDAQLLFHMTEHPSIFLQETNAALMLPTPLVGLPPVVELLSYRAANDKFLTGIGDNFSLLLDEGGFSGSKLSGCDIALKAALTWKSLHKRQVVVLCGNAPPDLCGALLDTCCTLFEATPVQRSTIKAGMHLLSAFTTTTGQRQMCYLQAHLCVGEGAREELQGIRLECNHLFVSGIGESNGLKIFTYILCGLNEHERERLYINHSQRRFACQSSVEDTAPIACMQEEYFAFMRATETLGLSGATLQAIFRQLAAIVHLTEMKFDADGTLSNISALENVACLLQLDLHGCLSVFSTREVCVTAAQLLYRALVATLIKKVNAALHFSGETTRSLPSITVIVMPPLPPAESDALENIVRTTMYEDVLQAFLRSSDHEVTQWQRAGLCVPGSLQELFAPMDNYGLLKVLYGLGGVLSVARSAQKEEEIEPALASCTKSAYARLNASTLVLTFEHSFGVRHYQFPRTTHHAAELKSVYHADFNPVRTFLIENSDVETQEILHFLAQTENGVAENIVAEEVLHVRPLLQVLQDNTNMFWWLGSIQRGVAFNGKFIERQLRELPLRPALALRRHLHHHYIACQAGFIVSAFRVLSPSANASDTEKYCVAVAILDACGATYHVTPEEGFLVTSNSLVEMHRRMKEKIEQHATLVQAFARTCSRCITLQRRVAAWTDLLRDIDLQRKRVVEEEQYRFKNCDLHLAQLLDLMEGENAARSTVKEECWGEYMLLQHSFQEQMEALLVHMVLSSIRKEEKRLSSARQRNHMEKLHMIKNYVQQRVDQHRAHLDSVVEKELGDRHHHQSAQRLTRAHERLLSEREQSELRRRELEADMERKHSKSKALRVAREQAVQVKNEKLWRHHLQARAFRERIKQAHDDVNETIQVQVMLQDMEDKMTRLVKDEIVSFRRQEVERLAQRLSRERQQREEAAIQAAKVNERKAIQREVRLQRAKEEEERRKRHAMQNQLDMQQRERRAVERLETVREQQKRRIMRELAGVEVSLRKLPLYEHFAGRTSRANRCDRQLSEPLVLTGGKKAYTRVLSESSLRGLFEYHTTKPRARSPYPYATPKR
ncbi:hypothetical protein TRSC58_00453 [Trypanosoma rangeli SC58]|uniref:Myosin motor domain-containing protein n=1 Tax=Trypanosoma rangeli SC58 TaxID=429131 RepID=A0A061JA60_TRYRA|nr:hypothetical protein TRSC58_00453 [Trypanosoma rangeli SC58]